jgi:hypothetical protein
MEGMLLLVPRQLHCGLQITPNPAAVRFALAAQVGLTVT